MPLNSPLQEKYPLILRLRHIGLLLRQRPLLFLLKNELMYRQLSFLSIVSGNKSTRFLTATTV